MNTRVRIHRRGIRYSSYTSMKIGVITCPDSYLYSNYGTVLQAYALQRALSRLGYDAFLIRRMEYPDKWLPGWLSPAYGLVGRGLPVLRGVMDRIRLRKYRLGGAPSRKRLFRLFVQRHLHVTSCGYTRKERMAWLPHADAYICGSDQIWNVELTGPVADLSLFFGGSDRRRCISYAASAAWNRLGDEWVAVASKYLPEFQAVGVREEDGVRLCRMAGVSNPVVTIDPTLLLPASHYEQIMDPRPMVKEPYLLFYVLNIDRPENSPLEQVREYCAAHGYKLVVLSGQGAEYAVGQGMNDRVGPLEFLNLIKHARAVVTNSFHGSLFSTIFQVPFAVCLQQGENAAQNSRFFSTHSRLGQDHRIFQIGQLPIELLDKKPVEYITNIVPWRNESLAFLQDAIENIQD